MNLLDSRKNVFSQCGEDGVLEKIFAVLQIEHGTCVEFGAWDGRHLSNTCNLLENRGWSGVLIEGSTRKFPDLQKNFGHRPDITLLNRLVNFTGPDCLDAILASTSLPVDFDLLSIDVDGNDYHIMESLETYRPKVIVIEFNPTIPPHVEFVQARDLSVNHGNSLLSLTRLAERKGYALICCTDWNAFFVDRVHFPLFGIEDNSPAQLWQLKDYLTSLFVLYDGTIKLSGNTSLLWHPEKIDEEKIQVLPRHKRVFSALAG